MRCCASPTTSIAAEPGTRERSQRREAAAAFAAELLRAAFAPLVRPLGFFGEAVVDAVALSAARAERGGVTDAIERTLERASGERP